MRPEDYVKAALIADADPDRLLDELALIIGRGEALVMIEEAHRDIDRRGLLGPLWRNEDNG
jgi:hypothetical protein